jgi:hypothetical protein
MSFTDSSNTAMRMFLENMVGEAFLAKSVGMEVSPSKVVDATLPQVLRIANESLPLARVMDTSDLVLHAEGPGASSDLPWLSALSWLTATAETNLRRLSSALFDLLGADGRTLAKSLDLRLTGLAPGSIWLGVKLMPRPGLAHGRAL